EVEKFLDTPVKRYSSGMYVRLAFAVAAHLEPEILIVDEVLAVGDARFQKKCLGKMRDISQSEGRTILFVSHNLDSVLRLTSRTIWLDAGQLRLDATPSEVISAYGQNIHDSGRVVDLRRRSRPPNAQGNIEIAAVEFSAPAPAKPWVFDFGELLSFHCHLRLRRPIPSFIFAYAIFNSTGVDIASSHLPVEVPADASIGEHTVNLSIAELRLAPGSYTLNLAVYSEQGIEDFQELVAYFDVSKNKLAADERSEFIRAAVIPPARVEFLPREHND
ncbi:MAG TPA: Wzt carbohydrate-binding domain-containing protein, partial [Opitutales bacterium]|nr:Wzt carbohydrate-binding domain-containing protein [Opitutales bacterium]